MRKAAEIIFDSAGEFGVNTRRWQGTPSIEKTGKRLWAAWFSGGRYEPCILNYGILGYSDDEENWIEPYMVVKCNQADGQRIFDLQLWAEPNGRLWVYWCQDAFPKCTEPTEYGKEDELWDTFFNDIETWGIYTDNPTDDRPAWSQPVYFGENCFIRNKPTVLNDGTVFVPAYNPKKEGHYQYATAKHFGYDLEVKQGGTVLGDKGFDECMLVQQNDDAWRFLVRTNVGYIGETFSFDEGKTWTETVKSNIPNPCTRFYVGKVKEGILLVNTPKTKIGDRTGLVASLSVDGGKTWEYNLTLDTREQTTYPDVTYGEDGYIYVIYDCQRDNRMLVRSDDDTKSDAAKEICLSKFTVEDIKNGNLVSAGSYTAKVISKVYHCDRD